ncbi:HXK2-like protein [Mya arenaria]|uniref:Phosphotransferase n=1 Tax=Mya arenaria TaxID=6604 RepID=A0ABY7FTI4_MYAAR|nr:HXK2-like protein [Mya arenaria]
MEPLTSRNRINSLSSDIDHEKVVGVLSQLVYDDAAIRKFIETFEEQIRFANSTDEKLRKQTDLFWENTFVRRLFDGTESGTYLGIDLGGTNFRIVRVDMTNGFTFSFPSTQMSLRKSIITTWTKRIKCSDGPGLDSVILLEEAIERLGSLPVSIEVVGRISDTTGTLLAGNLLDHKCLAGLIIGTGSNAAYVEYTKNIEKWDACYKDDDPSEIVCINTEFGCLGDNGCLNFLRNDFVREVDEHSVHPGSFTFERNFSGLYLGELVRVALIRLANEGLLFKGQSLDKLSQRWAFSTKHVTDIESNPTTDDILLVREVAELTSTRGAFIIATAMVVLLNHINQPEVTIAVDGSLYEHHPNYHNNMMAILSKWRPQTKTTLKLVKDGSGQGGALVAAIAQKSKAT